MQPFLALITPIGVPEQPPVQPPLGIWGGGNVPMPSPPIANVPGVPGYQPPLGIWGGGNVPMPSPPIAGVPGVPGYQPPSPGVPTHPIYYPPQIWGPTDPRPGWGLPGPQPPFPEPPLGIWGPYPGFPTPPIELPPDYNPGEPPAGLVPEGKALVLLYVPGEGFKAVLIPKPGPGYNPPSGGAVPAPVS